MIWVRNQIIENLREEGDIVEAIIGYNGTLAVDLHNGMKKGQHIQMKGKSILRFKNEKITEIQNYS